MLTTATTGASIHYTFGDTLPTATSGTLISSGGNVTVIPSEEGTTLNAIAFIGSSESEVHSATYVCGGTAPGAQQRVVNYVYTPDKLNRSTVYDTAANGATSYVTNPLNQYTSVGGMAYNYDAKFNLTWAAGFSAVYDASNRMVAASNSSIQSVNADVELVYDGLGRCVKRTTYDGAATITTIIIYDDWKPIAEWDGWTEDYFQTWNVYGPGADEILLRQGGKWGYVRYHSDANGNVTFLLDNDGEVVEKYTYDVFGRPKIMGPGGEPRAATHYDNRFLFQGREYLGELGVYDYRNRFYHPDLGRFLQIDPIGFDAGDMNLFRYCGDDPVNRSDPKGLYAISKDFTPEQRKQLEEAQKLRADKLEAGANKIDAALKAGEKSEEFQAVKKDFEGVMGKSLTAKDMAGYAERARRMVTGLRDDGTKGYKMLARNQAYFKQAGLPSHPAAGVYGGKLMFINVDLAFLPEKELGYSLSWILGHEAAHNQWVPGDIYRSNPAYKTMTPQQALDNADKHVEFSEKQ